jgi:hypothetical protein
MIKTFGKITLAGILAAVMLGAPVRLFAEDNAPKPAAPTAPAKPKAAFFRGKLAAVDTLNKTITVENKTVPKRTFEISSDTKITKDGKPATLGDGVIGDDVRGSYVTNADGKFGVRNLVFGKPPTSTNKPAATTPTPAPAK